MSTAGKRKSGFKVHGSIREKSTNKENKDIKNIGDELDQIALPKQEVFLTSAE